jgi:hypothetical protein
MNKFIRPLKIVRFVFKSVGLIQFREPIGRIAVYKFLTSLMYNPSQKVMFRVTVIV